MDDRDDELIAAVEQLSGVQNRGDSRCPMGRRETPAIPGIRNPPYPTGVGPGTTVPAPLPSWVIPAREVDHARAPTDPRRRARAGLDWT